MTFHDLLRMLAEAMDETQFTLTTHFGNSLQRDMPDLLQDAAAHKDDPAYAIDDLLLVTAASCCLLIRAGNEGNLPRLDVAEAALAFSEHMLTMLAADEDDRGAFSERH